MILSLNVRFQCYEKSRKKKHSNDTVKMGGGVMGEAVDSLLSPSSNEKNKKDLCGKEIKDVWQKETTYQIFNN